MTHLYTCIHLGVYPFQALSEFVFEPTGGELRPLESKKVRVTFHPLTSRSVRRVIEITVEDGKDW